MREGRRDGHPWWACAPITDISHVGIGSGNFWLGRSRAITPRMQHPATVEKASACCVLLAVWPAGKCAGAARGSKLRCKEVEAQANKRSPHCNQETRMHECGHHAGSEFARPVLHPRAACHRARSLPETGAPPAEGCTLFQESNLCTIGHRSAPDIASPEAGQPSVSQVL